MASMVDAAFPAAATRVCLCDCVAALAMHAAASPCDVAPAASVCMVVLRCAPARCDACWPCGPATRPLRHPANIACQQQQQQQHMVAHPLHEACARTSKQRQRGRVPHARHSCLSKAWQQRLVCTATAGQGRVCVLPSCRMHMNACFLAHTQSQQSQHDVCGAHVQQGLVRWCDCVIV